MYYNLYYTIPSFTKLYGYELTKTIEKCILYTVFEVQNTYYVGYVSTKNLINLITAIPNLGEVGSQNVILNRANATFSWCTVSRHSTFLFIHIEPEEIKNHKWA